MNILSPSLSITQTKHLVIPKDVVVILSDTFKNSDIETISFEPSSRLMVIEDRAFMNCSQLRSVSQIPKTLRFLENGAFLNCKSLTSVSFEPRVQPISFICSNGLHNPFWGCEKLTLKTNAYKLPTSYSSQHKKIPIKFTS